MPKNPTESRPAGKQKPEKPFEGFPLFPHPSGQWARKINRKLRYFGVWADPAAALERHNHDYPFLKDGRTPPPMTSDGVTLRELCNAFLRSKEAKANAGELSARGFRDHHRTCALLVKFFGKERRVDDLRPDDFEPLRAALAKKMGPVSLKTMIVRVRVVFKFAYDNRLIETPIAYGQSFSTPSPKTLRKNANAGGEKVFEADEVRRILDLLAGDEITLDRLDEKTGEPVKVKRKPEPDLRAMILLALNGGLGNADVASLPLSAVDLDAGFIDFPRVKTAVRRRIPLMSETVAAIREWLPKRPKAKDKADADLVFLTPHGSPWVRTRDREADEDGETKPAVPIDALSPRFKRLLTKLDINGRRRLGFYCLRHCTQTFGGEARDPDAVSAIMGHTRSGSMAANYTHRISDERLRAVVDAIRDWLRPGLMRTECGADSSCSPQS